MYPGFIADAQTEEEKGAEVSFHRANEVEKTHQKEFERALAEIESGEDLAEHKYYICQVCGQLEIGEAPEICPICKAPKSSFVEMA
jgi:rubrerythrin